MGFEPFNFSSRSKSFGNLSQSWRFFSYNTSIFFYLCILLVNHSYGVREIEMNPYDAIGLVVLLPSYNWALVIFLP